MSDARAYRDVAIVLRGRPFGEADRILTLLTREHGKVDAVAKAVRRPKTKLAGLLELASEVDIEFHRGRSLDVITDASLRVAHWQTLLTPDRYAVMTAVLESLDFCTERNDPQPELFDLLRGMLAALTKLTDPISLVPRFELRILDIVGYGAEFSQCVRCGREIGNERAFVMVAEGGSVCLTCEPYLPADAALSSEELRALTQTSLRAGGSAAPRLRLFGKLGTIVHQLFLHQIGRTPRGESAMRALLELDAILSERPVDDASGNGEKS